MTRQGPIECILIIDCLDANIVSPSLYSLNNELEFRGNISMKAGIFQNLPFNGKIECVIKAGSIVCPI